MCPICLTSLALWFAGVTSTGSFGWLLLRRARHCNKDVTTNVPLEHSDPITSAKTESTKET